MLYSWNVACVSKGGCTLIFNYVIQLRNYHFYLLWAVAINAVLINKNYINPLPVENNIVISDY